MNPKQERTYPINAVIPTLSSLLSMTKVTMVPKQDSNYYGHHDFVAGTPFHITPASFIICVTSAAYSFSPEF